MGKAIGETHRRYTRMINYRHNWRGYLWQGRFTSYPMDEEWMLQSVAYVELNPVRAGMVQFAWEYPWSSVHVHLSGEDSLGLVNVDAMREYVVNWTSYLLGAVSDSNEVFNLESSVGQGIGCFCGGQKIDLGQGVKRGMATHFIVRPFQVVTTRPCAAIGVPTKNWHWTL